MRNRTRTAAIMMVSKTFREPTEPSVPPGPERPIAAPQPYPSLIGLYHTKQNEYEGPMSHLRIYPSTRRNSRILPEVLPSGLAILAKGFLGLEAKLQEPSPLITAKPHPGFPGRFTQKRPKVDAASCRVRAFSHAVLKRLETSSTLTPNSAEGLLVKTVS